MWRGPLPPQPAAREAWDAAGAAGCRAASGPLLQRRQAGRAPSACHLPLTMGSPNILQMLLPRFLGAAAALLISFSDCSLLHQSLVPNLGV